MNVNQRPPRQRLCSNGVIGKWTGVVRIAAQLSDNRTLTLSETARRFRYDVGVKTVIEGKWTLDGQNVCGDAAWDEINSMLRTLTLIGSGDGGWSKLYRHPDSGTIWELTYPQGEMHGGGPPRLEALSDDEAGMRYPGLSLDRKQLV